MTPQQRPITIVLEQMDPNGSISTILILSNRESLMTAKYYKKLNSNSLTYVTHAQPAFTKPAIQVCTDPCGPSVSYMYISSSSSVIRSFKFQTTPVNISIAVSKNCTDHNVPEP